MNRRGSTKIPQEQEKEKGARLADYNGTQYTVISNKNMSLITSETEATSISMHELTHELSAIHCGSEEATACHSDFVTTSPSTNVRTEVKQSRSAVEPGQKHVVIQESGTKIKKQRGKKKTEVVSPLYI